MTVDRLRSSTPGGGAKQGIAGGKAIPPFSLVVSSLLCLWLPPGSALLVFSGPGVTLAAANVNTSFLWRGSEATKLEFGTQDVSTDAEIRLEPGNLEN